ncbi:hypothetical protein CAP36_10765 [Chitinophagaceae bacterium IBVUCB2]|nr:hypothetical protein CAP36_10765 [Chitinophagaceae bacterium IBVUCB2]
MRRFLSEKNIVVLLFVLVLITFSLAQEDSKKMERMYTGASTSTASSLLVQFPVIEKSTTTDGPTIVAE